MVEQEPLDDYDVLEETIQECVPPDKCPGSLLTGWVLVCEWVDPADGEKFLTTDTPDSVSPWLAKGMLDEAVNLLGRASIEIEGTDD